MRGRCDFIKRERKNENIKQNLQPHRVLFFNILYVQYLKDRFITMSSGSEDVFKEIFPKLMNTIRAASSLGAQDVNFYKTVDKDLGKQIDEQSQRLLNISNDLLRAATDDPNDFEAIEYGQENVTGEASWKPISRIIDSIFDKIDSTFDQAKRKAKGISKDQELEYLDDGITSTIKNEKPSKTEKPQLKFKVPIDNSEAGPFKPKLSSKPHALVPFNDSLINPEPVYEDSIEIIDPPFYAQPYEYEIDNQPYPDAILAKSDPIPPKDWSTTKAIWVDTVEELHKMVPELKKLTEIAVDLEHHDYRSYYGIVCLMQISSREKDWIVDTLVLRDDLTVLNEVFADPNIVKVFHGAFMDIIWLQRDLGLYVVSLFDTYHASRALGFPRFSLAYLLEVYAHFKTSKQYQLADWRIRPLSPPMLAYARSDTHFLLFIYDQLKNKLIDANKLAQVLYDSRQVAKRRFEYTKYRPMANTFSNKVTCPVMAFNPKEPWGSIVSQYNVPHFKRPVVEVLYKWRDLMAKQQDESVRYIMPNQLLVSLVNLESPVDLNKILNVSYRISDAVRINAKELANLIEQTLKDTEANDWDLVDQWNKQQSEEQADTSVDVASIANEFDKLLTNAAQVFEASTLLTSESKAFGNIYHNKPLVTLEFRDEKVFKHNFNDAWQKRLEATWKELTVGTDLAITIPISDIEDIEEEEEEEESEEDIPEKAPATASEGTKISGQAVLFNTAKEIDPNELITLRKRNVQPIKRNNNKKVSQEEQKEIDYANADKILLKDSKKKNDRKKRGFDPYGRDSEGPKPAKKAKTMTSGRTSTYKKKMNKYK